MFDVELRLVTSRYNEVVCLEKKKGFDYKALLLDLDKDVTLETLNDVAVDGDGQGGDETNTEVEPDKTK